VPLHLLMLGSCDIVRAKGKPVPVVHRSFLCNTCRMTARSCRVPKMNRRPRIPISEPVITRWKVAIQVPEPTPAFLAISSSLAFAPERVNFFFCHFPDAFSVPVCVRARLSVCNFRSFRNHQNSCNRSTPPVI
jgi:hypothetical protein